MLASHTRTSIRASWVGIPAARSSSRTGYTPGRVSRAVSIATQNDCRSPAATSMLSWAVWIASGVHPSYTVGRNAVGAAGR